MKYVIEFLTHEGRRLQTKPFENEQGAKLAALAIRLTLKPYSTHDPDPQIVPMPDNAWDTETVEFK